MELLPMQPGDVPSTMADVTELEQAVGFRPSTTIQEGIARFVEWYKTYYGVAERHGMTHDRDRNESTDSLPALLTTIRERTARSA